MTQQNYLIVDEHGHPTHYIHVPDNDVIADVLGVKYNDGLPHPGDNEEKSGKLLRCTFI